MPEAVSTPKLVALPITSQDLVQFVLLSSQIIDYKLP